MQQTDAHRAVTGIGPLGGSRFHVRSDPPRQHGGGGPGSSGGGMRTYDDDEDEDGGEDADDEDGYVDELEGLCNESSMSLPVATRISSRTFFRSVFTPLSIFCYVS